MSLADYKGKSPTGDSLEFDYFAVPALDLSEKSQQTEMQEWNSQQKAIEQSLACNHNDVEAIREILRTTRNQVQEKAQRLIKAVQEKTILKKKLVASEKKKTEFENLILEYKSELDKNIRENEMLRKEQRSINMELDQREAAIKEKAKHGEREEEEAKRKEALLSYHELRIRRYWENLSRHKKEIVKLSREFAAELRSSSMVHPLEDYLNLTETELLNLEVQLKKTPTLSFDRPKLENAVQHLSSQRELLRSLIAKSKEQMQEQAENVVKISQKAADAFPPLPPKIL